MSNRLQVSFYSLLFVYTNTHTHTPTHGHIYWALRQGIPCCQLDANSRNRGSAPCNISNEPSCQLLTRKLWKSLRKHLRENIIEHELLYYIILYYYYMSGVAIIFKLIKNVLFSCLYNYYPWFFAISLLQFPTTNKILGTLVIELITHVFMHSRKNVNIFNYNRLIYFVKSHKIC